MTTETKRKIKAETMRKYRTYKHIESIINKSDAIALTFSFSEKTLKNTNEKTRLQYIKRYLNAFACDYVLNKDYGKINNREHYHAIATPKYKIFLRDAYKLGNLDFKKIHNNGYYKAINKSNEAIAKRFLNHATKETTHQSKIIFARKNRQSESKYKNRIDAFLNGVKPFTKADFDNFIENEQKEIEQYRKQYENEQKEMLQTYMKNTELKKPN